MEVRGRVKTVAISRLKPNPWNPNMQTDFIFDRERRSIRKHGFIDPVLVRAAGSDYEIIDGEHRWRAAKEEGLKEVMIIDLGKVDDAEAKRLTIIMNETRGKADHDRLKALLKDLEQLDGAQILAEILPFSQVELDSYLKEARVDWDSIGSPLVVGEETPAQGDDPVEIEPPRGADSAKTEPGKKVISVSVPDQLFSSFFEQIDRINMILNPEEEPKKVAPAQAIEVMLALTRQADEKAILATLTRRSKKSVGSKSKQTKTSK